MERPPRTIVFGLQELQSRRELARQQYHEFLRIPAMSLGLYEIPAGGTDPQEPHAEDEAYYIIQGRSMMFLDGANVEVKAGDTIFVAAGAEHRFHGVTEDLAILVFFAPAEHTQKPKSATRKSGASRKEKS